MVDMRYFSIIEWLIAPIAKCLKQVTVFICDIEGMNTFPMTTSPNCFVFLTTAIFCGHFFRSWISESSVFSRLSLHASVVLLVRAFLSLASFLLLHNRPLPVSHLSIARYTLVLA